MIWALIIIVGFILDRLSKIWVLNSLVDNPITVIKDFFYLEFLENKGASFGILQGKTLFLTIMTSIVAIILVYVLKKYNNKFIRTTLALILGGALGNLYDRVSRDGKVVDFLEFHFGSYVFPSFNVADMLVVVGTILLAIYVLFFYKEEKEVEAPVIEQGQEEKQ